jgi:hypothetical protein
MHLKNGRSCPPHAGAKRLSVHGALPPPESCPSPQSCAFRARCSANGSSVRFVIANRALPGGLAISGNAGPPFELDAALGIKRVNRHADRRRDAMLVFVRPNSLAEYRKHQLTEMVNHPSKTADQTRAERTGPRSRKERVRVDGFMNQRLPDEIVADGPAGQFVRAGHTTNSKGARCSIALAIAGRPAACVLTEALAIGQQSPRENGA